jgi:predicted DNA-binding protein (MmcQ/YjbR family)
MTRQEIIEYCLTFPAAYEDYPFDDITDPGKWTVIRHSVNNMKVGFDYAIC